MNSKLQSLLQQFERAVGKLSDVLGQKQDEYIRDSAIQRFEFTFELAWKTLKAFLEEQGITVYSPRDSLRSAFQIGLIGEDPDWLGMIELRNLTSHTYNEAIAEEIYRALPKILTLYMDLLAKLKKKIL
ncbi:MAG: nucleotidyltransferase [Deltaproteobacteria bacterium RIFCSPLOWO2_12_FULL_43_16]|nr:MAG: nucleotidyltransferase [Deltaproteobacteria bacterium GWA2_43_19]OGQ12305.1 MAG: nucleotidyltransferase [Deltaproteobacteria bacterium RIFCSPHIGHO2_02_FULL_43_33]OGQ41473.1 MAG: nucleotidyltransferase [Deltaproteobacteria bacterium RIFCSPLOWO2_01_FULL_42_9]OGQ57253.1 MAG: nucleotidyltransferase [Deltaproteobacteria bacterium RIFCSPLOWO2_12_FULL_43_16]